MSTYPVSAIVFRQSLFWDADPKRLDTEKNARYIIERVLDFGNAEEIRWLFQRYLSEQGKWVTTLWEKGTLYGLFLGAKVSFIAYPSFRPLDDRVRYQSIHLLSPRDIAAMKIVAVSQRGKKRDFFDLYWLAHHGIPLKEAILGALE
ncbi:MAG: nucleotidyl transferase AbiEii/AbiGii toxin family protein [Candidatus Moraniibacteriota bacterium]|nr:MAG: nucleotidyl transferase AbiEii/AbiGii toxin family protein [Candidatus Moranbacteria bacterium]